MGVVNILFSGLITAALIAGLAFATRYLIALANKIKHETINEQVVNLIVRVRSSVIDAVKYVNQTYVNEIKAASEDGKLTDEEKREAKNRAIQVALDRIKTIGQDELSLLTDNIMKYISDEIEVVIDDLKKE